MASDRCQEFYRFEDGPEYCTLTPSEHREDPPGYMAHESKHATWFAPVTAPAPGSASPPARGFDGECQGCAFPIARHYDVLGNMLGCPDDIRRDARDRLASAEARAEAAEAKLRDIRGAVGDATPGLLGSTLDGVCDLVRERTEAITGPSGLNVWRARCEAAREDRSTAEARAEAAEAERDANRRSHVAAERDLSEALRRAEAAERERDEWRDVAKHYSDAQDRADEQRSAAESSAARLRDALADALVHLDGREGAEPRKVTPYCGTGEHGTVFACISHVRATLRRALLSSGDAAPAGTDTSNEGRAAPAGWGWCPNSSLRIPKGECGCCEDVTPDTSNEETR